MVRQSAMIKLSFLKACLQKNCFSAKKGKPLLCQVLIVLMRLPHLLRPKLLLVESHLFNVLVTNILHCNTRNSNDTHATIPPCTIICLVLLANFFLASGRRKLGNFWFQAYDLETFSNLVQAYFLGEFCCCNSISETKLLCCINRHFAHPKGI